MKDFIVDRIKKWNTESPNDQFIYACSILYNLIIEKGFGLAGDITEGTWTEFKIDCITNEKIRNNIISVTELQSMHNINIKREIYSILINEISEELISQNMTAIAYIQFISIPNSDNGFGLPNYRVIVGAC